MIHISTGIIYAVYGEKDFLNAVARVPTPHNLSNPSSVLEIAKTVCIMIHFVSRRFIQEQGVFEPIKVLISQYFSDCTVHVWKVVVVPRNGHSPDVPEESQVLFLRIRKYGHRQ